MKNAKVKLPSFRAKRKNSNSVFKEGREKVGNIYKFVKEHAHDLYEDSKHKIDEMQHSVGDYSEVLAKLAKEKPLATSLIAGGVVFLVSLLMLKKK